MAGVWSCIYLTDSREVSLYIPVYIEDGIYRVWNLWVLGVCVKAGPN